MNTKFLPVGAKEVAKFWWECAMEFGYHQNGL
jgi:hypothetical protein